MVSIAKWSIKDIATILTQRQNNEFDGNIAVSGDRGDGKSTLVNKLLYRFSIFKPWLHQVYSRDDVMNLLKTQSRGLCWDDEAINTGYKRDWQNRGQQELIKILTAYRDNFNIFASAIPNFFSLDKDLRDLYFIHIHVIERGIGVLHMPLQGRLYSQDRWDAKYNAKIEESWSNKGKANPSFKPPFHRLSTFRGYIFFNDVTKKQQVLYKEIKKLKRQESFTTEEERKGNIQVPFEDKVYNQLFTGKLSKEGLMQICLLEGKKYSTIVDKINRMLKDNGETRTLSKFLRPSRGTTIHSTDSSSINQVIPDI